MGLFETVATVMNPVAVGGTLLGGGLDYFGSKQMSDAQRQANADQMTIARENMRLQEEFAKMGIRWRVEDAKAAGIHPLAALGASGASFSPVGLMQEPDLHKGAFLSRMGQNLTRSAMATMTPTERLIKEKSDAVQLKELAYRDKVLDHQMTMIGRPTNPPMPDVNSGLGMPGQGDARVKVDALPLGRTFSSAKDPSITVGSYTSHTYRRMPGGRLKVVPGPDIQGVLANNLPEMVKYEWELMVDQRMNSRNYKPLLSEHPLPPGMDWHFDPISAEWFSAYPDEVGFRGLWNKVKSKFKR